MFDSPNSTPNLNPSFHPLSNFPFPSSLPFLPPFINTYQDLLSDHHFPLPNVHETLIVGETGAPGSCAPPSNPKPPPKGRHSKIHTSQGLRDRRVRLSIGIARQFFDLQDMLGFDKASKTLDWLFSKSKNAIKDLARSKHESPASSDCHVATTGQTDSIGSKEKKKKKITRARKKICCGNPTAMNQSALTRASTSISAQKNNNNYYFPNLALDWDDSYNPVLQPSSSFVVSSMNLSGTGLGAQREHTMY